MELKHFALIHSSCEVHPDLRWGRGSGSANTSAQWHKACVER